MEEYEKRAKQFLEDAKTKISIHFFKWGIYFDDDKEARDIYKITLRKTGIKPYTFKFGQSIHNSNKEIKPTAYDILACLTKYDVGDFNNFCSDFGYSSDSIKALKTYKAVLNEYKELKRLFTSKELEKMREIN